MPTASSTCRTLASRRSRRSTTAVSPGRAAKRLDGVAGGQRPRRYDQLAAAGWSRRA